MGSLNPGGFSYVAELARVPIGGGGVRWAGDLNPGGFSYVAELARVPTGERRCALGGGSESLADSATGASELPFAFAWAGGCVHRQPLNLANFTPSFLHEIDSLW